MFDQVSLDKIPRFSPKAHNGCGLVAQVFPTFGRRSQRRAEGGYSEGSAKHGVRHTEFVQELYKADSKSDSEVFFWLPSLSLGFSQILLERLPFASR